MSRGPGGSFGAHVQIRINGWDTLIWVDVYTHTHITYIREQFEGCPHYITVTEEESGHGANKLMHYRQKAFQFFHVMGKVGVALNTRRWDAALALASNPSFLSSMNCFIFFAHVQIWSKVGN